MTLVGNFVLMKRKTAKNNCDCGYSNARQHQMPVEFPFAPQSGFFQINHLHHAGRSEEHTSELQSHSDPHSFPTRRSSDLSAMAARPRARRWRRLNDAGWKFCADEAQDRQKQLRLRLQQRAATSNAS